MKKVIFLSVLIAILHLGCGIVEPRTRCANFVFQTVIFDSILYKDLTGDTINTIVKYHKDSIKYKIISNNLNIDWTKPIISKYSNNFNVFSSLPYSLNNISDDEKLFLIYYFNELESDTVSVEIKNSTSLYFFYNSHLILQTGTDKGCEDLFYLKK